MAFAPLFELNDQFQAKNGHNLTGGFLRVYLAFTDDPADTYSDYEGTRNPANIVIDDNGRAVVICDSDKAYRLEVYDSEGMLLWTQEPVFCTGTGGGGGTGTSTRIESTDQSINVVSSTAGGVTTYDIGIASDTKDMLEWAETGDTTVSDGDVFPEVNDGTMESEHDMGIFLHGNQVYHVTNSFEVYPTGYGINYDTLNVKLMLDSTELCSRSYDIDNSVSDPVECEFSYDVATSADGYLHWTISGASAFSSTTAKMQIHRVYSGLAAVPSSYATKIYVDSSVSSKIDYSALEYNTANYITGISGSAIAGGLDSSTVSAIASSYAESAASGKLDNSASSLWYPMTGNPSGFLTGDLSEYATTAYVDSSVSSKVDQSAFDDCCSSMSGYVSSLQNDVSSISSIVSAVTGQTGNYIDWSASGTFQPSGNYVSSSDMSAYVPYSSLAGENNVITSISGSAVGSTASGGKTYTGIWPVVVDNTADTVAVENKTLAVDETMTGYESAGSAVIGVNTGVVLSGLTAYQPASAMTAYQPVGNYIYASALGTGVI